TRRYVSHAVQQHPPAESMVVKLGETDRARRAWVARRGCALIRRASRRFAYTTRCAGRGAGADPWARRSSPRSTVRTVTPCSATPCGSPTRGQQITQPIDSGVIVQRFAAQMFCAPVGAPRYIRRTSTMAEARSLQNVLVVDDDERILGSWKRAARERNV